MPKVDFDDMARDYDYDETPEDFNPISKRWKDFRPIVTVTVRSNVTELRPNVKASDAKEDKDFGSELDDELQENLRAGEGKAPDLFTVVHKLKTDICWDKVFGYDE